MGRQVGSIDISSGCDGGGDGDGGWLAGTAAAEDRKGGNAKPDFVGYDLYYTIE